MGTNSNLTKARIAKNDEFYTRLEDIEQELYWYKDYFKDKVVYLPCDDPTFSKFWTYFHLCFDFLGLKRLVSTHFSLTERTYKAEYCGGNDSDITVATYTDLEGNGDFRNQECLDILNSCDVVVTNPPFSLFREFVRTVSDYDKKFLILGTVNAVTYREVFTLIKENKCWAGYSFNKVMDFVMPDSYEIKGKGYVDSEGKKHGFVPGIAWYTNIDTPKRHEKMILENKYSPEKYPTYDDREGIIEVSKVTSIPGDYYGMMGVPITYLDKHCPEQFDIVWLDGPDPNIWYAAPVLNGQRTYRRIIIKRKEENNNG